MLWAPKRAYQSTIWLIDGPSRLYRPGYNADGVDSNMAEDVEHWFDLIV